MELLPSIFCTSNNTAPSPPRHIRTEQDRKGPKFQNYQNNSSGGASLSGITITRQGSSGLVSMNGATTAIHHDEPEVDYDEGATELYRKIEGKDWDGALVTMENDPMQAKTWIS
eukprot:CAMPEP_0116825430 /NCGR_PEP_ID=MMETSP0418-20121206/1960_1 /TAXON_ID=1158023 /ORGANISM="Astrosyne radiata, Strain 13vi08-1A" /LENGTH=113 /DNA_ID=CAMNT_0004453935 /DNA_START=1442 /DNA_END=1779 /DNA_ORIENTATION=-